MEVIPMLSRTTRAFGLVLLPLTLALGGCEKTQGQENKEAAKAQGEATEKAAKAQAEANDKIGKAQQDANVDAAKAQADANDKSRDANETYVKRRSDYKVSLQKQVNDLDKQLDELKIKAAKATGKAKTDAEMAMKDTEAKRTTVQNDMRMIDATPSTEWDTFKAKVDREVADFKKSVDNVKL
jgi:hypothetical protein